MEGFKFNIGDKVFLLEESEIVEAKIYARSLKIEGGNWKHGGQVIPSSIPEETRYEHYLIEFITGRTRSVRTILAKHLFATKEELKSFILSI